MLVTGYPKSGNTWFSLMLSYCLNVPYDNLMEPGVHPREKWQRELTKGGLPHKSFADEVSGEVVFHHDPSRLEKRVGNEYSIYIVRDGRDVMTSYYYYRNNFRLADSGISSQIVDGIMKFFEEARFTRSIAKRAAEWADDVRRSLALNPDQIVRYEDLNTDTAGTLTEIFRKMKLDVDPAIIEECVRLFSFEHMAGRTKGSEDSKSFFRKGIIGDWKEKFREKDKAIFKKAAGDVLIGLGYEKNDDW